VSAAPPDLQFDLLFCGLVTEKRFSTFADRLARSKVAEMLLRAVTGLTPARGFHANIQRTPTAIGSLTPP
jgi:hypothetical protein